MRIGLRYGGLVVGMSVLLAGCGGGDNPPAATPTPTSTPLATPTPVPSVRARIVSNDRGAVIGVSWASLPTIPTANILEYQVYRDGQPIGVTSRNQNVYTDEAEDPIASIILRIPSPVVNSSMALPTIIFTRTPLVVGVPHVYTVNALYDSGTAQAPIYQIALVGESSPVTLPAP